MPGNLITMPLQADRPVSARQGNFAVDCRRIRRQQLKTRAFMNLFTSKKPTSPAARDTLLSLIEGTERGLATTPEQLSEIMSLVNLLEKAERNTVTTGSDLSATWKLLWTTEKESLFIINPSFTRFFKTSAGDVYQVIDMKAGRLQNVITFPPEGAFVVESTAMAQGPQRTAFKFQSAKLKLPNNKSIQLPPFGQGWFDTVYTDEDIRVAKDIRGDTLIVQRDGAPRWF